MALQKNTKRRNIFHPWHWIHQHPPEEEKFSRWKKFLDDPNFGFNFQVEENLTRTNDESRWNLVLHFHSSQKSWDENDVKAKYGAWGGYFKEYSFSTANTNHECLAAQENNVSHYSYRPAKTEIDSLKNRPQVSSGSAESKKYKPTT